MRDTLLAGGASAGTMAAITSTTVSDLVLRGLVSVVVGVITWSITQMIKKQMEKRKCGRGDK